MVDEMMKLSQRTLPGEGGGPPRTCPRRGQGRPEGGGRGTRSGPRGRSSAVAASQAAAGAQPRSPARRRAATATAAGARGAPAWGRRPAPATGRRRGPRGRPVPGARLLEAAGRRSPPRAPGPPRSNGNCSSIDWAPLGERPVRAPRASACGRQGPGSAARVPAPRGGRSLPYLCVCRRSPSPPEDFRERLGAAFPACEARTGWMSEQHDYPLASKLSFF
ncbi:translation initiation factor IF-2-like [Hyaena hyaena]|uniref:translation initiation factor IF-2-like n=1 Tax=Hyaena hyaena TaxID=95912 RepID=UPI001921279B|nr:translation initiation factor IF-2-like [Hyaena hyaena]